MQTKTLATILWMLISVTVSAFRPRIRCQKELFRVTRCMMAAHIPKSELRLGQSMANKTPAESLDAIVFDLTISNLFSYLEGIDKPALEWFDKFLADLPPEDDQHFEQNVMNKLINSHASLFEFKTVSDTNVDVSMKFSHVVEPWVLAALLLNSKKTVLKEMQSLLTLVLQENAEAATYAYGRFKYGWAARSTIILDPRDPKVTSSMVQSYQRLNMFVTNIALSNIESSLKATSDLNGADYLIQTVGQISDEFLPTDLRIMRPRAGEMVDLPQKLLELLLQQGYADLAEQDITHVQIEKILNLKEDELKVAKELEAVITSKSIISRNKKIAEENEALKATVAKVTSHRISQDVIAHRAAACGAVEALLSACINSDKAAEEEREMMARIEGKEVLRMTGSIGQEVRTLSPTGVSPSFSVNFISGEDPNQPPTSSTTTTTTSSTSTSSSTSSSSSSSSSAADIAPQGVSESTSNSTDTDTDTNTASVNAGSPLSSPPADQDTPRGVDDDRVGNAISDLLGSIFRGFRGDNVPDESETATEPHGERVKASTAILDPPGSDLPPPVERYTPRDKNDNDDAVEKRNPVNWGEEVPEGTLSAFLALGPNARVRYISQKEECGKKYIQLEGKSMAKDDSASVVVKQWINYDEALEFLKNGFKGPESTQDDEVKIEYKSVLKDENSPPSYERVASDRESSLRAERAQMM